MSGTGQQGCSRSSDLASKTSLSFTSRVPRKAGPTETRPAGVTNIISRRTETQRDQSKPVATAKLSVIALTKEIVTERGQDSAQVMDNFLAAGYRKNQVLEVLIGVALKTMSNYVDHISPTELDPAFQAERKTSHERTINQTTVQERIYRNG